MDSYSIRLACVGAMIGVMTLSAAALGSLKKPEKTAQPALQTLQTGASAVTPERQPVLLQAEQTGEAGAGLLLALHTDPALDWDDLTVSGPEGSAPAPVNPDRDGDAALGPLLPGCYSLQEQGRPLGEFVLNENASVAIATGRLWTDGEVLYLEDFIPSEAELRLTLTERGYYSFSLVGEDGLSRCAALFLPENESYDPGGVFLRTLRFPGLPAGHYTLCSRGRAVAELDTRPGEVTAVELQIGTGR